jgi:glycosyltransferase involved in cell wall biosynthesis
MAKTGMPIVFWAWRKRPSSVMRGIQVAEALSRRGFRTDVSFGLSPIALRNVCGSIIVCVKSRPLFPGELKRRGNRIVYDAIDFTAFRGVPSGAEAVIAGSEHMRKLLLERLPAGVIVKTIYHHADPNLKPNRAGDRTLKLAYVGERTESSFLNGEIPDLNFVPFKRSRDWREDLGNYNAHFSARVAPRKSVVKLANVAASEAVFLTGAEPGCVELLGEDYPFFLRDPGDLGRVREDVKRLKEAVGTELWKDARRRIERVRPMLTIEAAAGAYEELFAEIA